MYCEFNFVIHSNKTFFFKFWNIGEAALLPENYLKGQKGEQGFDGTPGIHGAPGKTNLNYYSLRFADHICCQFYFSTLCESIFSISKVNENYSITTSKAFE